MRQDYTSVKNIYIICGKTDMRKGIDGLATLIQDSFELDPYGDSIFLFAGWKKDRYKCLYFDGDGFAMLYKRLDNVITATGFYHPCHLFYQRMPRNLPHIASVFTSD